MFYKTKPVVEFQSWRGMWIVCTKADDYEKSGTAFARWFYDAPTAEQISSVCDEAEERWAVSDLIKQASELSC